MPCIYSYVVAFDSGFAPNPFYGFCTLATCKPQIRDDASINDWIVGTGSDAKKIRRGGNLVYAMRVTEIMSFSEYWQDARFEAKKPSIYGSYKKACGDNIYSPVGNEWKQLNYTYHSNKDGTQSAQHMRRDTKVNRVLISDEFVYYGAQGPRIPESLQSIVHSGRGYKKRIDTDTFKRFEKWIKKQKKGYQGEPYDMVKEFKK